MTDEERQAIKGLEWSQQQMRLGNLPDYDQGHYADVRIVLNLIEKQSKEIESLKEDKEIIKRNYEDLVDENEKFLYDSAVYLMGKDDTNSKWEDKIKAKIEELENQKRQWIEDRDNIKGCTR